MKPSEVIKTYGWVQRRSGNEETGFCLIGAVYHVYNNNNDYFIYNKVFCALHQAIHAFPSTWNDTPGRTKKEVIKLLESIGE